MKVLSQEAIADSETQIGHCVWRAPYLACQGKWHLLIPAEVRFCWPPGFAAYATPAGGGCACGWGGSGVSVSRQSVCHLGWAVESGYVRNE